MDTTHIFTQRGPSSSLDHCSCHYRLCELEVIKYLVENSNVDINAKIKEGGTLLDHARR